MPPPSPTPLPDTLAHADEPPPTTKPNESNDTTTSNTNGNTNGGTKGRSVSFNRDVHVKRFAKALSGGARGAGDVRREPLTRLSAAQLRQEAARVRAQAAEHACSAAPRQARQARQARPAPDKFYSLPHRRRRAPDDRRNSDDADDSRSRGKERTSLSTLFRRAQRTKSPTDPPPARVPVKRSKSDVTDLKSNTDINQTKPIRKRSGSETEEFLRSLRDKKTQLSPIIESSPREDYFTKIPPLEVLQNQILSQNTPTDDGKVNPVEKPPRLASPEGPHPPRRIRRGRSSDKELSPPTGDAPRHAPVDEVDCAPHADLRDKIKESIRKIEENVYADRSMIHSSQRPPDKPPLTRRTVPRVLRLLRAEPPGPPPALAAQAAANVNQPFSYTRPSVSPDANLFARHSPENAPPPVNSMDPTLLYARVHRERVPSDEDEGLGREDRREHDRLDDERGFKITDSPIKPKFREFRLTNFEDLEPTYANEFPSAGESGRGRADGTDKPLAEPESARLDLDFNELSHRRQMLESRLHARRTERERSADVAAPITRYYLESDPMYEAEKRMAATERYVDETARYYRRTMERERAFPSGPREEPARLEPRFRDGRRAFPPEPEYEPPSLESTARERRRLASSHDTLASGARYRSRTSGSPRRAQHASNPELAREEQYANVRDYRSLRRGSRRDSPAEPRLVDSGIEQDWARDTSPRPPPVHADTTAFLEAERQHALETETLYANEPRAIHPGDSPRGFALHPDRSPSTDDKLAAKPPKAKKLSGLEKMRQLFSRDSSKKSRKEKEEKPVRTRVLASPPRPPPATRRDSEYTRYTDPEPEAEIIVKKVNYECSGDARRRSPRDEPRRSPQDEPLRSPRDEPDSWRGDSPYAPRRQADRYRSPSDRETSYRSPSDREASYRSPSDRETSYRSPSDREASYRSPSDREPTSYRHHRSETSRRQTVRESRTRDSSERDSDRPSDGDPRPPRPRPHTAHRETERSHVATRRRLATPSPTPSPPRRRPAAAPAAAGWFKSLDRLTRRKNQGSAKVEKDSIVSSADGGGGRPRNTKNLRFFGDTDAESEARGGGAAGRGPGPPRARSLQSLRPRPRAPAAAPGTPHRDKSRRAAAGDSGAEDADSGLSQRSVVYLHAATVGDIPCSSRRRAAARARSRDDVSSVSSSTARVRSSSRSFSVLAPWAPRRAAPPPAATALHYDQRPAPTLRRDKSYSHSALSAPRRASPPPASSHRGAPRVSRALSAPKGEPRGWLRLRGGKPDADTRVR